MTQTAVSWSGTSVDTVFARVPARSLLRHRLAWDGWRFSNNADCMEQQLDGRLGGLRADHHGVVSCQRSGTSVVAAACAAWNSSSTCGSAACARITTASASPVGTA